MARPTKSLRYYIKIHCWQRNQIYRFHQPQSDSKRGTGRNVRRRICHQHHRAIGDSKQPADRYLTNQRARKKEIRPSCLIRKRRLVRASLKTNKNHSYSTSTANPIAFNSHCNTHLQTNMDKENNNNRQNPDKISCNPDK